MNAKTTYQKLLMLKRLSAVMLLLSTTSLMAQTVSNVFPTRVTTKSTVTVTGSGFTPSTSVSISGISTNNFTFVSANEMSFDISTTGNDDITANLLVSGVDTDIDIEYIAPTAKILKNGETSNVTKITEIFTTYNGFWRSSQWKADPTNQSLKPNTRHDLLAFTYNGVTYSTGVDDALLTSNEVEFSTQLFYAYTTNGVDGITQGANYIAMADLIDGEVGEGTAVTSPEIAGATIYDVLIDGVNGLDLGTGVTNFNQTSDVQFYSSGGQLGAIDDDIPDFLISQIANAGSTDIYYYADSEENVVGRPLKLTILQEGASDGDALLAEWRLDLYNLSSGASYGVATPQSLAFSNSEERPLRMAAFKFEDFEISPDNIDAINNINMVAGGTADLAFLAYNRGSFDIKTPVVTQFPVSRNVCQVPSSNDITLVATADVSGGPTDDPDEELEYQWYKYNTLIPGATSNSYTLTGGITQEDLALYRLKVTNEFGAVIVPATVTQGGTPVFWNGTEWELPPVYTEAGILSVPDEERGLVFSSNYNQSGDLEGCDCTIPAGNQVTIPSGSTLKLYNSVTVESGGTLTIADNANLIQTKDVTSNNNSGNVRVKRDASDLHEDDFIFWSSPVNGFNVNGITNPYTTDTFQWDVNAANDEGVAGDWIAASGTMTAGEGYVVQVPTEFVAPGFTATFIGVPRNGTIGVDVFKSVGDNQPAVENSHWNLLGNPYPSAISADELFAENTQIEGHVRVWAHDTDISNADNPFYTGVVHNYSNDFVTYNGTGATPPNTFEGNIASGQGFYVQVLDTAPETSAVTFSNSLRYDDEEEAYDNSSFYRNADVANTLDEEDKELVWLSLVDANNVSSSALVGYVPNATDDKDRLYDTYSENSEFSLFSLIGTSKMNIQGRSLPFSNEDTVPLGFNIPEDGIYTIGIDMLQGDIFVGQNQGIYLEDTLLGLDYDLRNAPYSFTAEEGTTADRFILFYVDPDLSVNDNTAADTFAFLNKDELHVRSNVSIKDIQVYDISGKNVTSYTPDTNTTDFKAGFQFSKGVYLTVITLDNDVKVTKKLIN
ncbi:T9SS type A sorting domain-containing protein [Sediminibacter sp. Hel_I_10]|uniref:T9SS type A sorting domain-containing protein n=1 Tax=Sediminibacter sp. Hel_I_10 TaxID=1392490 RepID=UPI000478DA35|nr:T9SS type A sorting domain-containing protein [Sediminibacter sp. Hel_I_10]